MFNTIQKTANQALSLLCEPRLVEAAATWPVFSITSFLMVSRLHRLGLSLGTIIDVGANVGQFAVASAKYFPHTEVHSYEPVPESFARLQKAASKLANLKAFNLALGAEDGDLQMNVNSHSQSSSALPLENLHKEAFPSGQEVRTITARSSTLDTVYRDKVPASPILLKLDVQGFEENVLNGGREFLRHVQYIVLELSFVPLYVGEKTFHETFKKLDGLGFEFVQPLSFLTDPRDGKYLQMDGLFVRRNTGI